MTYGDLQACDDEQRALHPLPTAFERLAAAALAAAEIREDLARPAHLLGCHPARARRWLRRQLDAHEQTIAELCGRMGACPPACAPLPASRRQNKASAPSPAARPDEPA